MSENGTFVMLWLPEAVDALVEGADVVAVVAVLRSFATDLGP